MRLNRRKFLQVSAGVATAMALNEQEGWSSAETRSESRESAGSLS